jgi:hypothetical protein
VALGVGLALCAIRGSGAASRRWLTRVPLPHGCGSDPWSVPGLSRLAQSDSKPTMGRSACFSSRAGATGLTARQHAVMRFPSRLRLGTCGSKGRRCQRWRRFAGVRRPLRGGMRTTRAHARRRPLLAERPCEPKLDPLSTRKRIADAASLLPLASGSGLLLLVLSGNAVETGTPPRDVSRRGS